MSKLNEQLESALSHETERSEFLKAQKDQYYALIQSLSVAMGIDCNAFINSQPNEQSDIIHASLAQLRANTVSRFGNTLHDVISAVPPPLVGEMTAHEANIQMKKSLLKVIQTGTKKAVEMEIGSTTSKPHH